MSVDIAVVTAHIAALDVQGQGSDGSSKSVTMNDFADIKEQADIRLCPQFQPDITRQITFTSIQRDSFGDGPVAKQTLIYTIPYVLLYEPVGSSRGLTDIFPNLVYTMSQVVSELIEHDTPQENGSNSDYSVDLQIAAYTLGGTVVDPAGNLFHGANVSVIVREFIN